MIDRLVLAFDTSFGPVSAALATVGGSAIASRSMNNLPGTQAETLPPLIAEMFNDAGAQFRDLVRIAVTVGPGAFTGVRVGLAFAKGMQLATAADIVGLSTLECLAIQVSRARPSISVGAVIDAKRDEVYVLAIDAQGRVILPAALMTIDDATCAMDSVLAGGGVLTGSGAVLLRNLSRPLTVIDAGRIDVECMAHRAATLSPLQYPAVPAYLRAPDARLPA